MLVDKLVEECTENIDETKIAEITLFEHNNVCKFICILYIGIATYFVYYKYMNCNKENVYQTVNY